MDSKSPYVIYLPSITPFAEKKDEYWWKACLLAGFQNEELKIECIDGLQKDLSFQNFLLNVLPEKLKKGSKELIIVADQINRGIELFEMNTSAQILTHSFQGVEIVY